MTTTQTTAMKTNHHYLRALVVLAAALALAAILLVVLVAKPAHASDGTIVVTSTGDESDPNISDQKCDVDLVTPENQCTLRAAIENTNVLFGDTILFDIPGNGVRTISPTGEPLPDIIHKVIINGYSQHGAISNTLAKGDNAVLKIQLDGSLLGSVDGLHLDLGADNSVIRGLVINRFGDNGIRISAQNAKVEGNFIGTDPSGTMPEPNTNEGVLIRSANSFREPINNTIGGKRPDQRNVISGNFGSGVQIESDSNNLVNNYIGTDRNGTAPLGNGFDGVGIVGGASNNTIGGATRASGNTIAFNQGIGVTVSDNGVGNRVLSNSIFSNLNLGIDLNRDGVTRNDTGDADVGASTLSNALQNFPVVTSAKLVSGATTIKGKLNSVPNQTFTVQFFASPEADDVGGFGEGKIFLGKKVVTTDPEGNATFTFKPARKVGAGKVITATATDPNGNTSEFSAARKVVRG
jgi:CSLREA domain-containing protein